MTSHLSIAVDFSVKASLNRDKMTCADMADLGTSWKYLNLTGASCIRNLSIVLIVSNQSTIKSRIRELKHLSISHLHRQEYHHESRKPDATSAEPENARALCSQKLCASIWCHNSSQSTYARQHPTNAAAITRVE